MSEAAHPIDPARTPAAAMLAELAPHAAAFAADPLGRRMLDVFRAVEMGATVRAVGGATDGTTIEAHVGPTRARIVEDLGLSAHDQIALAALMDGPGSRLETTLRLALEALPAAIVQSILVARLSLDAAGRSRIEVDGLFLNGVALASGLVPIDEAVAILARFEAGLVALPSDRFAGLPDGIDRLPFAVQAYGPWLKCLPPALHDEFPPTVLARGPAEAWGLFRLGLRAILDIETDAGIPGLHDNNPKLDVRISLPARDLDTA